jgi:purine nucleosidase
MGGAFLTPGNAARWGEANIWHDPEAAQMVFEAGWPITAVGLDVTHRTLLSEQRLVELADCGTSAARHISLISRYYLDRFAAHYGRRECTMRWYSRLLPTEPSRPVRRWRGWTWNSTAPIRVG